LLLASVVEDRLLGRRGLLLVIQSGFESLFDEPTPNGMHGVGVSVDDQAGPFSP
jgi:hypothetical protein